MEHYTVLRGAFARYVGQEVPRGASARYVGPGTECVVPVGAESCQEPWEDLYLVCEALLWQWWWSLLWL